MRARLAACLLGLCFPLGVMADSACKVKGPEYLQDTDFALEAESSRSKHWTGVQHAGEKSYATTFDDGVLTIDKIGTQPWHIFRQRLDPAELAGKLMAFSAELKLDLSESDRAGIDRTGGGMHMTIRSRSGRSLKAVYPHEPHLGSSDWFPVQLVVRIPRNVAIVELGFRHEAEGSFQVRKPSFREVKGRCEVSPGIVTEG